VQNGTKTAQYLFDFMFNAVKTTGASGPKNDAVINTVLVA